MKMKIVGVFCSLFIHPPPIFRITSLFAKQQQPELSNDPWKVLVRQLSQEKSKPAPKITKEVFTNDVLKCPHFGVCSGCTVKGNFTEMDSVNRARSFFQNHHKVTMRVHEGNNTGWRTTAKLSVQSTSRWGGLKMGLYRAGSHDVLPVPQCVVHHPLINSAAEELRLCALSAGVRGFTEQGGERGSDRGGDRGRQGELKHVQLSVERRSGQVQLVLVWTGAGQCASLSRLLKTLRRRDEQRARLTGARSRLWHSVSVNLHDGVGNRVTDPRRESWRLERGKPAISEKMGLAHFLLTPMIFRQANPELFSKGIIPLVIKNVPNGSKVSELYSGIGVLGINVMASGRAKEVLCSDSNEYVDEIFDKCVRSLPEEQRSRVFFECLSAESAVGEHGQCGDSDVLIVDPPRKGLDEKVTQFLRQLDRDSKLKRVIYVSCGYDSMENDVKKLCENNRWRIRSADAFILFPGTDHIETVVVLDRSY